MDADEMSTDNVMDMMDASLLQGFASMGTTDKDVLIGEFQRLLGPNQLSQDACAFFLDANNWNLQQAVCSYFDMDGPKDVLPQVALPQMTFAKDVTIGDGEEVSPNTKFIKTWRIANSGPDRWPMGCSLRFIQGDQMSNYERILVDPLSPGQTCDVSIEMCSPSQPGMYQGQWRMSTSTGQFFGEMIWVIITVAEGGVLGLTQQMNSFHSLGGSLTSATSPAAAAGASTSFSTSPVINPFGDGSPGNNSLLLSRLTDRTINPGWPGLSLNGSHGPANPIDRLKATPTDDNQENCFRVVNQIISRSPSQLGSPAAATAAIVPTSPATSLASPQVAQSMPPIGPALAGPVAAIKSELSGAPPTPPEEMIEEDVY